jgi:hypothetical protein
MTVPLLSVTRKLLAVIGLAVNVKEKNVKSKNKNLFIFNYISDDISINQIFKII